MCLLPLAGPNKLPEMPWIYLHVCGCVRVSAHIAILVQGLLCVVSLCAGNKNWRIV